jgi:hypothetical protein
LTGEGAEKVENLHVTLAYIGDRQQQTVTAAQVRKVVELLAAKTAAQRVTVSGIGRFGKVNQTGTQAFYATVDGPALHDLNEHLTEVLEGIGVVFDDVHGFQPHITLAYVPEGEPSPVDTLSDRPVLLDRIGLEWGTQTYIYPLLPAEEKEVGALPSGAPRKQRQLQEAWESDLDTALRKLRREIKNLLGQNVPVVGVNPVEMPEFSDRQAEQLQEHLDRWDLGIAAMEASGFGNLDKLGAARMHLENLQAELNRKDERNTRLLLAALAIFAFSDTVQRRGEGYIRDGMMLSGMPADHGLLGFELRDLGSYLQGSLLPDLIGEYVGRGDLSQRLERRALIFYGGALWSAMQLATMTMAEPGTRLRVEGPQDSGNCRESDPGDGVACETIVGQTYTVGEDVLPVLGRDTKCRQACRHWWGPA